MKNIGKNIFLVLVLINFIVLNTCFSCKHCGYAVLNCTNDTLLFDLSSSETITDEIYWGIHPGDTIRLFPEDTTTVYVKGKKTTFLNYYYAIPDTSTGRIYPFPEGTCYLYTIKWQVATRYSFDEIRDKKLYERRIVTREEFRDSDLVYEYRYADHDKGN